MSIYKFEFNCVIKLDANFFLQFNQVFSILYSIIHMYSSPPRDVHHLKLRSIMFICHLLKVALLFNMGLAGITVGKNLL